MSTSTQPTAEPAPSSHLGEGRRLEYLTIGWNVLEAIVSVWAGLVAGSTALVGFGIDSVIESSSGAALLWRLREGGDFRRRERLALRLVGVSFLALAAWVTWEAVDSLVQGVATEVSYPGMVIAAVSLVVMPWLAHRKRVVAGRISSRALESDSRQTSLCAYLSAILLGGLALNALLGWWWADAVAALVMVPIIVREGIQGLRGEVCEDCCC